MESVTFSMLGFSFFSSQFIDISQLLHFCLFKLSCAFEVLFSFRYFLCILSSFRCPSFGWFHELCHTFLASVLCLCLTVQWYSPTPSSAIFKPVNGFSGFLSLFVPTSCYFCLPCYFSFMVSSSDCRMSLYFGFPHIPHLSSWAGRLRRMDTLHTAAAFQLGEWLQCGVWGGVRGGGCWRARQWRLTNKATHIVAGANGGAVISFGRHQLDTGRSLGGQRQGERMGAIA